MRVVPTENLLEKYFTGSCMFLAVALHDALGWEIRANVDSDDKGNWIDHAWAVNSTGVAVDIDGVHSSDDPTEFSSPLKRNLSRESIRTLTGLSKESFETQVEAASCVARDYKTHFCHSA